MKLKEKIFVGILVLICFRLALFAYNEDQSRNIDDLTIDNLKLDNEIKRIKLDSLNNRSNT